MGAPQARKRLRLLDTIITTNATASWNIFIAAETKHILTMMRWVSDDGPPGKACFKHVLIQIWNRFPIHQHTVKPKLIEDCVFCHFVTFPNEDFKFLKSGDAIIWRPGWERWHLDRFGHRKKSGQSEVTHLRAKTQRVWYTPRSKNRHVFETAIRSTWMTHGRKAPAAR